MSEIKEEVRDLKALFNPNSQYSNKLPFTDTFAKKKAEREPYLSVKRFGGKQGHHGSTLNIFDPPMKA
ncbi:hypothetical protein [Methanosarcina sp. 2.H.T.1A.3]|uniref:hypothetical protein n=1 Tax=Methanosarcina sp. 2.H.T.1A.3 TaxID=1483597 RepID=UPI001390B822|nr:hypothetical protein [Methanosarcina sp. 2.H.T.1A.3]